MSLIDHTEKLALEKEETKKETKVLKMIMIIDKKLLTIKMLLPFIHIIRNYQKRQN